MFTHTRYRILLCALLIVVIAAPLLEQAGSARIYSLLISGLLLTFLCLVERNRLLFGTILLLSVFGVAINGACMMHAHAGLLIARNLAVALAVLFVAGVLLRNVLRSRASGAEPLAQTVSVYLLISLAFAEIYHALFTYDAGAFTILEFAPFSDFVYFSIITLTSLGYGDITPVHPLAKSLVMAEGLAGILYIAVLVSHLINRTSEGEKCENQQL